MGYHQARDCYSTGAQSDLARLQYRLVQWQLAHFGRPEIWQMAMGMIEEMGELAEASLHDDADMLDAVGDVGIYGCQLLTLIGCSLDRAVYDALGATTTVYGSTYDCGLLAHTVLKGSQGIRGLTTQSLWHEQIYNDVVRVFARCIYILDMIPSMCRRDLGTVITDVAETTVLKRGKGHAAIPG